MIPPVGCNLPWSGVPSAFDWRTAKLKPKLSSKPSAYKRLLLLKHQEDSLCSREVPSSILVAKTTNLHLCSWC